MQQEARSSMPEQLCRCCARTNIVPDEPYDAFVSCPECGQVLGAPSPWFSRNIPICDTRAMIAWPGVTQDPLAPADVALVPWELTCQMGKVSKYTSGGLFRRALEGIVIGAFFLG